MKYSSQLKAQVLNAVLADGALPQRQLAEHYGVGLSTLQKWLRQHRAQVGESGLSRGDKRPQDWTAEERLEALLASHGLTEQELGRWCRERGVHTHHLAKWRAELVRGSTDTRSSAQHTRALREENRALKKELRRKDKALAETTALLVLKKKAAAIWGEPEDD